MKIFGRQYYFSFQWFWVCVALCFCLLFIRLGYWQLARAAEKRELQSLFIMRASMQPLSLAQLSKETDIRYDPLQLSGHYDNAHTFLLDNQIYAHRVGYEVITPFVSSENNTRILVNRGWVAAGINRNYLPIIPAIQGTQKIVGHIHLMTDHAFVFKNISEKKMTWPLRVQVLDKKRLEQLLHAPIYPFSLWLLPDPTADFVRVWQPIAVPAEKHIGYAMQWFAFAFILVIICIVRSVRKI